MGIDQTAIGPIIVEISKYVAMSVQASPEIFLSNLFKWVFLVQLGVGIDWCINKKKYFYVVWLLVPFCYFPRPQALRISKSVVGQDWHFLRHVRGFSEVKAQFLNFKGLNFEIQKKGGALRLFLRLFELGLPITNPPTMVAFFGRDAIIFVLS